MSKRRFMEDESKPRKMLRVTEEREEEDRRGWKTWSSYKEYKERHKGVGATKNNQSSSKFPRDEYFNPGQKYKTYERGEHSGHYRKRFSLDSEKIARQKEQGEHMSGFHFVSNYVEKETSSREYSIEKLLKMKKELMDEVAKDENGEENEFNLFKAKVLRNKIIKQREKVVFQPDKISSPIIPPDQSSSEEGVQHTAHSSSSDVSSEAMEEILSLIKKQKLKKKKKKKVDAHYESRLTSSDSETERKSKKLKQKKSSHRYRNACLKQKQDKYKTASSEKESVKKEFKKHKRNKRKHGKKESTEDSSENDSDMQPMGPKIKLETTNEIGSEEFKDSPKKGNSSASLNAIQRILEKQTVEVVELDSDEDIQEIPFSVQAMKIQAQKQKEQKRSVKTELENSQDIVTLSDPEEYPASNDVALPEASRGRSLLFVDVFTNTSGNMTSIEVFSPVKEASHYIGGQCGDLAGEFIKYLKQSCGEGLVMITPSLATFDLLLTSVMVSREHRQALDSIFTGWTDLVTLNCRTHSPEGTRSSWLNSCAHDNHIIDKLLKRLKPGTRMKSSQTEKMEQVLDLLLEEEESGLEPHILPLTLPQQSYLVVVLQVTVLDVQVTSTETRPMIRGLGFKCSTSAHHHHLVIPKLSGDQIQQMMPDEEEERGQKKSEKEALKSLLEVMLDQRDVAGLDGVAVVTPRKDRGLAVLLAALGRHSLMQDFQELVDGMGSVEDLARKKGINLGGNSSLAGYEKYYFKRFGQDVSLDNAAEVAPAVYQVLEELLLYSKPTFANCLSRICHPLVSGYTLNLLKEVPYFQEGVHEATMFEKVFVRSGEEEIVTLQLVSTPKTMVGMKFHVTSYGKAEFSRSSVPLDQNSLLVISVKNTSSGVICLEKGAPVGLAHANPQSPFDTKALPARHESVSVKCATKPPTKIASRISTQDEGKIEHLHVQSIIEETSPISQDGMAPSLSCSNEATMSLSKANLPSEDGSVSATPTSLSNRSCKETKPSRQSVPTEMPSASAFVFNNEEEKTSVPADTIARSSKEILSDSINVQIDSSEQGNQNIIASQSLETQTTIKDIVPGHPPPSFSCFDESSVSISNSNVPSEKVQPKSTFSSHSNKSCEGTPPLDSIQTLPDDMPSASALIFNNEGDNTSVPCDTNTSRSKEILSESNSQQTDSSEKNNQKKIKSQSLEEHKPTKGGNPDQAQFAQKDRTQIDQACEDAQTTDGSIERQTSPEHSLEQILPDKLNYSLKQQIVSEHDLVYPNVVEEELESDKVPKEKGEVQVNTTEMGTIDLEVCEINQMTEEERSVSSSPNNVLQGIDSSTSEEDHQSSIHIDSPIHEDDSEPEESAIYLSEYETENNHKDRTSRMITIFDTGKKDAHFEQYGDSVLTPTDNDKQEDSSPPRKAVGKHPSEPISYSHSPQFISSILRGSTVPQREQEPEPMTREQVEAGNPNYYHAEYPEADYPVIHLVEHPSGNVTIESEERVDDEVRQLAKHISDECQERKQVKKARAKREDWVVKKKVPEKKHCSQRRSIRVFVKDSSVNYAEHEDDVESCISSPTHERTTSPTFSSIPFSQLSLSTVAKIQKHNSGINESVETHVEEFKTCPTCLKIFKMLGKGSNGGQHFRRHIEKCGQENSSFSEEVSSACEQKAQTQSRGPNMETCPVCSKSYTMVGRGRSYYQEHMKMCNNDMDESNMPSTSKQGTSPLKENMVSATYESGNKSNTLAKQTVACHNQGDGEELVKIPDACNEIPSNFNNLFSSSGKTEHMTISKPKHKIKLTRSLKHSPSLQSDLGLFDVEGAKAGIVRMSTEPLDDWLTKQQEGGTTAKQGISYKRISVSDLMSDSEDEKEEDPIVAEDEQSSSPPPSSKTAHRFDPTTALVPQLQLLATQLPPAPPVDDLRLHFPSLLSVPGLGDVVRAYLRLQQVSAEALSQKEKQFGDLLVTELQCAKICSTGRLEEMVVGVYRQRPLATMDQWIRELTRANPGLESMVIADQMEVYFDLDTAMQVMLLYSLPAISAVEN